MDHFVNNHLGNSPIEVMARDWSGEEGIGKKLVCIRQSGAGLSFQHSMTTSQARLMADALLACCEELEGVPS